MLVRPADPVEAYHKTARIYFDCRNKAIAVHNTIDCLSDQISAELK